MTLTQGIYYALGAVGLFLFLSLVVIVLTWAERKALARIQMRMGPMRVGFHGAPAVRGLYQAVHERGHPAVLGG